MRSTMVETNLSMEDFTRYFEEGRLGKLYFPNGSAETAQHIRSPDFHIKLNALYKLVTGWKVNHTVVLAEDIIAVVAFGSAVRFPGIQRVKNIQRKYLLFGPKVMTHKQISIQPKDADFLVLTVKNLIREEKLEPISVEDNYGGIWIEEGGIHLVNRGVSQFLVGIKANDTVSISAIREGVPIFFDKRFKDIVVQSNIKQETPRKIFWDEDSKNRLTGKIQNRKL